MLNLLCPVRSVHLLCSSNIRRRNLLKTESKTDIQAVAIVEVHTPIGRVFYQSFSIFFMSFLAAFSSTAD